jgi:hypothetical protein
MSAIFIISVFVLVGTAGAWGFSGVYASVNEIKVSGQCKGPSGTWVCTFNLKDAIIHNACFNWQADPNAHDCEPGVPFQSTITIVVESDDGDVSGKKVKKVTPINGYISLYQFDQYCLNDEPGYIPDPDTCEKNEKYIDLCHTGGPNWVAVPNSTWVERMSVDWQCINLDTGKTDSGTLDGCGWDGNVTDCIPDGVYPGTEPVSFDCLDEVVGKFCK